MKNLASTILMVAILSPFILAASWFLTPGPTFSHVSIQPAAAAPSIHADGYEPCAAEDAEGPCYWDASIRGNGNGTSFVVRADGTVIRFP